MKSQINVNNFKKKKKSLIVQENVKEKLNENFGNNNKI